MRIESIPPINNTGNVLKVESKKLGIVDKIKVASAGIQTAATVFLFEQVATVSSGRTIFERAVEVLFGHGSDHTLIVPPRGPGSKSIPNDLKRAAEELARAEGRVLKLGRKNKTRFRTRR